MSHPHGQCCQVAWEAFRDMACYGTSVATKAAMTARGGSTQARRHARCFWPYRSSNLPKNLGWGVVGEQTLAVLLLPCLETELQAVWN